MIVDVHAHWGPWFFTMDVGDVATNLALMARYDIDVQVVSATEAVCYDVAAGNAHLATVLHETGDTTGLRGYVTCDPRRVDLAERDLDRYLGDGRFVGVKVHTSYTRTPVTAPAMRELFALLNERSAVVLIHTWGDDLVDLARLVHGYPRVRVIAGHAAAGGFRAAPEAASITDRLWFEPAWSMSPAGRIRWLADHLPHDKLLFGTDATLIDPIVALGALDAAGLDAQRREAILGANARALFGSPALP